MAHSLDDLLADDLDDLLTFRLYLAQLQDPARPRAVTATQAVTAADALVARLSAQRWIAVRGAESEGASTEALAAGFASAKGAAREQLQARIAARTA